ncbi:MAG: response regulator [Myxococcota bacterium]|nr:response regulator [Myxococcota bacterium]
MEHSRGEYWSGSTGVSEPQYSFPIVLLTCALIIELLFVMVMVVTMVYSEKQVRTTLERQVRLERLQGDILHLDEVLTMSARMSASSGDLQWEERYKLYEPKLEKAISEAQNLLPNEELMGMEETNTANEKLVEMELEAFEAVRNGNKEKAQQLLFSPVYEQAKISYALGLRQRLQLLDNLVADLMQTQKQQVRIIQISGLIGWGILIVVWILVIKNINRWRNLLLKTRVDLQRSQEFLEDRVHMMARDLTRVEHKERERIAKLLHDQLQQLLVAARLHIHLLPESEHRKNTEKLIEEAIQESRTLTLKLNPPALMAGGLVEALNWLVSWMQENYNLRVQLSISEEVPPIDKEIQLVAFDSIRELLFNVVKHAGVKEAIVQYGYMDNKLVIIVQDRGVGFDLATTLSGHRFGLLNTLRRVELLGGTVQIETQPNQGCYVSLEFPVSENGKERSQHTIRIVLVDDHAIVRVGIRAMLDREPDLMVVGEASTLNSTLEIVKRTKPDLILMDISLGTDQPDGVEVTKQLRISGFKKKIIALSSYESAHYQQAMQQLDVSDYLIKGQDAKKLLNAIREAVI